MVAGKLFEDQPFLSSVLGVGVALVLGLVVDRVAAIRRRRRERSDAAGDGTPAESDTEEHPPALALMGQ